MDNVITITLKDNERKSIEFESTPTINELVAVKLIMEEYLEHNFNKGVILTAESSMYYRLEDVEEVPRK